MKRLVKLPPHHLTKPEYKGKTHEEVIAIAEVRGLQRIGVKTVNKACFTMSTLMAYGVKKGHLTKNCADGLSAIDTRKSNEKRKVYAPKDLERLFASPLYTDAIPADKPEKFWVPLIGLFTGARVNEICSLYVEDIRVVDGIHCFDINENRSDKSLKKADSCPRLVPIHPVLIEAGLLGYVEKLQKTGIERLWPRLTHSKGNGYAGAFSQWYGRYLRRHVTKDKLIVFHSFRHTFIDNLKQHEVNQQVIEALDGHKDTTMTGGVYGKDFKPKVLYRAIRKLDYGITFSGIKFPA
jgi:integrase